MLPRRASSTPNAPPTSPGRTSTTPCAGCSSLGAHSARLPKPWALVTSGSIRSSREPGGARPWRRVVRRGAGGAAEPGALLKCSFCGKEQRQVRKLIAGPGVYICNKCIEKAGRVIETGEPTATPLSAMKSVAEDNDGPAFKCSFCGKRRHQVSGLAVTARVAICTECLALCNEIIIEELA